MADGACMANHVVVHAPLVALERTAPGECRGRWSLRRCCRAGALCSSGRRDAERRRPSRPDETSCVRSRGSGVAREDFARARLVLGAPGRWRDDVPLAAGRRGSTAPLAAALLLTANRSPAQSKKMAPQIYELVWSLPVARSMAA
jgi:hypothetical protein